MDNLRLSLLIIGVLIVLGIYLWEIYKSPGHRKSTVDPAEDPEDYPGMELSGPGEQEHLDALSDPDDLPSDSGIAEAVTADEEPPHVSAPQSEQFGSEQEENDYAEVPAPAEQEAGSKNIHAEQDLIILYIMAAENSLFDGPSISLAAQEAGLAHGDKNIFNHYGAGSPESDQPLFSLANMANPEGEFDLDNLARVWTKGIALIMYLWADTDNQGVFELFLDNAHQIAAALGGDIYLNSKDRRPLDDTDIEEMRERISRRS